jgi:glycosyltransferase involved in cell wall biosynthesis
MPFTLHIDSNRTWGGGQQQSLGLALALAERGERTHFIAQAGSELEKRLAGTELPWESMSIRGIRGAWGWRQLRKRLWELGPDVVHVHDGAAERPAMLAARGPGGGRPRMLVTRRTLGLRGHTPLGYDRVICVSEAVRQGLLGAKVPAQRLVVIPDFVDCRWFRPEAVEKPVGAPGRRIVAVGRLTREKGHAVLLRAMARVVQMIGEARLSICGQGPEEERLRRQAAEAGIAERVEFAGFVADVRPALAAAEVVVMPSLSEGLGVAALEGMAMAKPVVATDAGGLPESVVDGETGVVVPAGEAEALAEAMVALLADPDRAQRMGRAGRGRALAHYDRGPIVDRVLALYHQVMAGGQ